jgi:hypothetical protein
MIDMRVVFWLTVALTISSGAAAVVLVGRRNVSAGAMRVAERLAQIALLGASAIMILLGRQE